MTDERRAADASLSVPALERIDRICVEFEAAWKSGRAPQIEESLGDAQGEERLQLLRELLLLDLDYRCRRAQTPTPDEYRTRFPNDGKLIGEAFRHFSARATTPPPVTEVRHFGDYALLEEIGRGGMGVVYRARQLSLNRIVAVKMILPRELPCAEEVGRFYREAEAAANLQHPNIVAIYEVGQCEGQHYFAMEYVEGKSLASIIREHPLSARRAAAYVKTLAEAIHYAHRQGTLHRDLKPSNVLIDTADQPKITDFGLAKRIEADAELTRTGQVLGTPSYMAPEQAAGKTEALGATSDVYSLGAILYESVTGRPPFQGESTVDTLIQVLNFEPVAPRLSNPKVPHDLETICLKCLQKEPSHRYESAGALAEDLDRFLRDTPIRARQVNAAERTVRWARRNPAVATLLAAVTIVLVVGLALVSSQWGRAQRGWAAADSNRLDAVQYAQWWQQKSAEADEQRRGALQNLADLRAEKKRVDELAKELKAERDRAEANLKDAEAAEAKALEAQEDLRAAKDNLQVALDGQTRLLDLATEREQTARGQLYAIHINEAMRACESTNLDRAREVLSQYVPKPGDRDLRGFDWHYLRRECGVPTARELHGHQGPIYGVALAPGGRVMAVRGEPVTLWDVATGKLRHRLGAGCAKVRRSLSAPASSAFALAFSPDAKTLALASNWPRNTGPPPSDVEVDVSLFDVATGSTRVTCKWDGGALRAAGYKGKMMRVSVSDLAFSPDGKTLAGFGTKSVTTHLAPSVRITPFVQLWDVATGDGPPPLVGRSWPGAFSPDGKTLAWTQDTTTIKFREIGTGKDWALGELRHSLAVASVAYSPEGAYLATEAGGVVRLWRLPNYELAAEFPQGRGTVIFSPHGRLLATVSRVRGPLGRGFVGFRLWDVAEGKERPVRSAEPLRFVGFLPDGDVLALAGEDEAAKLRRLEAGEEPFAFGVSEGGVESIAVMPDATTFAVAARDGAVRLLHVTTGVLQSTLSGHTDWVKDIAVSPNGDLLATASRDRSILLWDPTAKDPVAKLTGHEGEVCSVDVSPDGNTLASASEDKSIMLWDLRTRLCTATINGLSDVVRCVTFAPGGKLLVGGSADGTIGLWDVSTKKNLATLPGHAGQVLSVRCSPDGKTLASASQDKTIKLWDIGDVANPCERATLRGHENVVSSITFSRDGSTLASASDDHTIRLWDVALALERVTLRGHQAPVRAVAFSPDGMTLISATNTGAIRLWRGR